MKIFQKIKNEKCSGLSEDIRFVLKRRRRKRKHNVPVSNKQEVRETSSNEISNYIAVFILRELNDDKRNIAECEKILNDSLDILKHITLNNSILR